ncbi:MAG: hypothetical protein U0T33_12475 [Bacteroidales bacterium]
MKKIHLPTASTLLILIISHQLLIGQYSKVEEMTLGGRINSPISMDVEKSSSRVTFDAINKSYLTYDFTIHFSALLNLSPNIFEYHTKVYHGRNRICVFDVQDKSKSINYSYGISFKLLPADKADLEFPYFIPIGEGKIVSFKEEKLGEATVYNLNKFKMSINDTVYAIRKGTVIALQDNKTEVERFIKSSSLEILQNDGTIAIYLGLNPEVTFLKLGQVVYPGEPIGIISAAETLTLYVVAPKENGRAESLQIKYSGQDGSLLPASEIRKTKVVYLKSIMQKEMTSREIKKQEKGSLY